MAPRPNIAKRAAVIKAKLENPDASTRIIAHRVGLDQSNVVRTLQDARERGLLMTDQETQDFFTFGVIEKAAKSHAKSIAVHAEDAKRWEELFKQELSATPEHLLSGGQGDKESTKVKELERRENKRRKLAADLAEATSRALHARQVIVGNVNQQNSPSATFVMPVVINFTKSSAKALPPLRQDATEAVLVPETTERPA